MQNLNKIIGFVYLIYNHDNHLFKIGKSRNLKHRLNCISNQSGSPISLLGLEDHDTYDLFFCTGRDLKSLENYYHETYSKFRVKGEWFHIPDEMIINLIEDFNFNAIENTWNGSLNYYYDNSYYRSSDLITELSQGEFSYSFERKGRRSQDIYYTVQTNTSL